MRARMIVFAIIAVVLAAVFTRLGLWQLDRLGERRAHNALVSSRAKAAPAPFATIPMDSATSTYRRASLAGRVDHAHELVLASRTRNGSPGVYVFTPLRRAGTDTAVLVNRGWVYAPDGSTADLSKWNEGDSLEVSGYLEPLGAGNSPLVGKGRIMRRVTLQGVQAVLPYPVAPLYLVVEQPRDSGRAGAPARLAMPDLTDEGPHLGYAFQWFAFAVIALVGGGIGLSRARGGNGSGDFKGNFKGNVNG